MKKLVMASLLGLMLCTAGAFAAHPKGWGLGIVGQYGGYWGGSSLGGPALSLKTPGVPIFWGISLHLPSNGLGVGVTGDYYFIDQTLVKGAGLGWFFGLGGYFDFLTYNHTYFNKNYNQTSLGVGARLPIGLSWQPVKVFEIFIDFAPSLGVLFYSGDYYDYADHRNDAKIAFSSGWQGDLGLRFWF
jgi:hypothetical protein